jgi:dihydrofolate reductase
MSKVIFEMTISLDGYVTGPDVRPEEPMGDGGERLHEWMFAGKSQAEVETFLAANFSEIGAVIVGRRMADLGIGPWGEEPVFHAPCFVLTHRPPRRSKRRAVPRTSSSRTGSRRPWSGHGRRPARKTFRLRAGQTLGESS